MAKKRKKRTQKPLNKDRVLSEAMKLADKTGLDSLSMRNLGKALGVEAMSLYNHVSGKEEVLAGIIDIVVSKIELPVHLKPNSWKKAMRERAMSARQVFNEHPWAISLMESQKNPGPELLRYCDQVLGCLRSAGFSVTMAAHAYSVLDSYIYGFVMQEQNLPFSSSEELEEIAESTLEDAASTLPHLSELVVKHILKPGYSFANEFEFGLDLILNGLAVYRNK